MRFADGKDSWKTRQEAIERATELMTKKKRVANTHAIGDLITVLKERLSETNLNLRARVLLCVKSVADAIGEATQQYSAVLVPELLKLCCETKQNVLDGLYGALTSWVGSHAASASIYNAIMPSLVQGLKLTKGRAGLLHWMNQYNPFLDRASCSVLLASVMDCLTSKAADVRKEAGVLMKVLCAHLSQSEVESKIVGRPSPDMRTLHQIVDTLYDVTPTPAETPSEPPVSEKRKTSLSARPGVRVLGKPNPGEGLKDRFKNVRSSIPKPQPIQRRKMFSMDSFGSFDLTQGRLSGINGAGR